MSNQNVPPPPPSAPKLTIVPLSSEVDSPFVYDTDNKQIEVFVDTDEARVTTETISGMATYARVYQRGGKIVEPRLIPAPRPSENTKSSIMRVTDNWQISETRQPRVRSIASEVCHFTKKNKKGEIVDTNVPDYLASAIIAAPEWPFPVLSGIAEAPTLRPDGTLITQQGYDKETGIYLASDLVVSIPEMPSKEDAIRSSEMLFDVVCDFPFSSAAGKSVWLSGVLSVAARAAIDGPVPMHIIEASMRASGKSKLVDTASVITAGRPASRMIYSDSDEEMDKRITSLALAGDATVLIDNVVGEFGCQSLDAAITSTSYRGRLLGKSEMTPHMPMQIVWWATGNGMTIGADLARRAVLARLEPQCEHPEEREGPVPNKPWKHPKLLNYVMTNRGVLLGAALTIVRAYIAAGKPKQKLKPMDFEAWSDTVRSAIVWIGLDDPAATVRDVRAADVRADTFRSLMRKWPVAHNVPVTVSKLLEIAATAMLMPTTPDQTLAKYWKQALIDWCPPRRGEGELPSARALGTHLRGVRGVIVENSKIDAGLKLEDGVQWMKILVGP